MQAEAIQQAPRPSTKPVFPYLNNAGRPKKLRIDKVVKDQSQAYEEANKLWQWLALDLGQKTIDVSNGKRPEGEKRTIVELATAAGIAYDKAFGKRDLSTQPVSIPQPLASVVTRALLSMVVEKPLGNNGASQAVDNAASLHINSYQTQPQEQVACQGVRGEACDGLAGVAGSGRYSAVSAPILSEVAKDSVDQAVTASVSLSHVEVGL